jgi:uncharacterized protein (TIGR02270 family)
MADPTPVVIEAIVTRHFEEAAALWPLRDADVHGTQRRLEDLVEGDARVSAHLDGLRIAKSYGWDECSIEPSLADPGEAFVRVLLALEAKKRDALEQVLEAVAADDAAARGVVSAFGWVSSSLLRGIVKDFLSSNHSFKRRVGIAACAIHRTDPGELLPQAVVDGDETLKQRALRAIGELGRTDQAMLLRQQSQSDDPGCRFWAAWSAVMTGDRGEGLRVLCAEGTAEPIYRTRAMQVGLRVLSTVGARAWLRQLRDSGEAQRDVLVGTGITGDPSYVPWLIAQMEVPEQARLAGEAFSMITGVDLYDAQLTRDQPAGFRAGPTDDADDENVAMDPDQDLVWPEPHLVRSWWDANGPSFAATRRYLAGDLVSAEHCQRVLREGRQGMRQAAALELALMNPASPLFETRAPAHRQQRQLAP